MARPSQDRIDTFIRITGASESHAVRKLEEFGGNLDEAINSHYSEVERQSISSVAPAASPQYGFVNARNPSQDGSRGVVPFLSAARSFRPSLLLDPNYRRRLYNQFGSSVFTNPASPHSPSGGFNNGYEQPYHSRPMPVFEHASGIPIPSSQVHQFHGNISRDHEANMHHDDIEEQMIKIAIEASKQEELSGPSQRQSHLVDDELARAISLSLKTAKQEKTIREQQSVEDQKQSAVHDSTRRAEGTIGSSWQTESASFQEAADNLQERSLWGALSSKELDEAMLLEAALFGETPEATSFQHAPQPPSTPDKNKGPFSQQVSHFPSPSLMEQRALREQQDDEYLASLLADREKEMNASKEPGNLHVKEEDSPNKMLGAEAAFERLIAAKEASLPKEPAVSDENAVTLLVRMPDGSRFSRRFLKSDKLGCLFDFIDVSRTVKPGTYRVVRPFPRHSFCAGDSSSSLKELGLTNKQEALFLELI